MNVLGHRSYAWQLSSKTLEKTGICSFHIFCIDFNIIYSDHIQNSKQNMRTFPGK